MIFGPKPPPTSGAITSTFDSGNPNSTASPPRIEVGDWVESYTVSFCSEVDQRAHTARPSIGLAAPRSKRKGRRLRRGRGRNQTLPPPPPRGTSARADRG